MQRPDDAPKHNDPLNRLLICQSKTEGMKFLTHDSLLSAYDEKVVQGIDSEVKEEVLDTLIDMEGFFPEKVMESDV